MPIAPPAAFSSSAQPSSSPSATNTAEASHRTATRPAHCPASSRTPLTNRPTAATTSSGGRVSSIPTATSTATTDVCGTGVTRSCRSQPDARSKESRTVAPSAAPRAP